MSMSPTAMREGEAERLAAVELARVFRVALWSRTAGAPALLVFGLLLWRYSDPWRGGVCVATALPLFAWSVWELWRGRERWQTSPPFAAFLLTVALMHFAVIVVSGGISSPWVVVLPMLGLFQGVVIGRARRVMAVALIVGAFACAIALLALAGPSLELTPLARGPAPTALVVVIAMLLAVLPALAAGVGVRLRGALERAILSAAESRSQLVASMQERNDELVALAGALAHELKNPLAAIRGLAALQAKKAEPHTKQAEQLGVLLGEVARMGSILDELSNFSRPARGLALESVDPTEVVSEIVRMHEPLATERGVRLSAHVERVPPIACDPRKLKQILVNLMQNAIDASESGSEVRTVVEATEGWHTFRVEDRGSGLSDVVRGRLFTPGATTKLAGSGLGLTIARAIAEQHDGTLTLSERAGGGCTAEVRLPSRPPAGEEEAP
jgi:two-component system sensor histidine kinase HydH